MINVNKIINKTERKLAGEVEEESRQANLLALAAAPEMLTYIASQADAPQSLKDKAAKVKK
jgi:hypothetical protein